MCREGLECMKEGVLAMQPVRNTADFLWLFSLFMEDDETTFQAERP